MIYIFDDNMLLPLLLQRVEKRRLLARLKIEQKTEVLLVQYYCTIVLNIAFQLRSLNVDLTSTTTISRNEVPAS